MESWNISKKMKNELLKKASNIEDNSTIIYYYTLSFNNADGYPIGDTTKHKFENMYAVQDFIKNSISKDIKLQDDFIEIFDND